MIGEIKLKPLTSSARTISEEAVNMGEKAEEMYDIAKNLSWFGDKKTQAISCLGGAVMVALGGILASSLLAGVAYEFGIGTAITSCLVVPGMVVGGVLGGFLGGAPK